MSLNLNKVILAGNLTRDIELRYTKSGSAVATLNLAVNRVWYDQNKEKQTEVCFVKVVSWGKQAENCNEYLFKGSPCLVEGYLKYRTWEAEGQKRSVLEVVCERIQFLGNKEDKSAEKKTDEMGPDQDESIPF